VSVIDDPAETTDGRSDSASAREQLDAALGPDLAAMLVSALSNDLLARTPRDADAASEQLPPAS
jgi:hypothetical protein